MIQFHLKFSYSPSKPINSWKKVVQPKDPGISTLSIHEQTTYVFLKSQVYFTPIRGMF